MCKQKRSTRRGATLVEVISTAGLTVMLLGAVLAVMLAGSTSWARGMGKIGAETDSQLAVRTTSELLREAMFVSVDANGMGLTYQLPQKDASGTFTVPLAWDGVTRRIQATGTQLQVLTNGTPTVIASGLIFTDPQSSGGTQPYVLFTPGPGALTHQVTIEVAAQRSGSQANKVANRSRETIFLRNIPQLTQ